jgi:hypothetical protein
MATPKKSSTAVAKAKVNLPVDFNARMLEDAARLAKQLAAPAGDRITVTQDKYFKLPDGSKNQTISGIIVDFANFNAYYEGIYDPENIVPPNCFAIGFDSNDSLTPSANAPEKQAESCSDCWANQFKSAGKGKACKNQIKLALIAPDATDESKVLTLVLSATALRPYAEYVRSIATSFGIPPYGVVTEFSFDKASDYASVRFAALSKADEAQLTQVFQRRDDIHTLLAAEPDVSEFGKEPEAKAKGALKAPAKAKGRPAARV